MSDQSREHDDQLIISRCTECGYLSTSLGFIHGHAEKHNPGLDPWGIIPDPRYTADPEHLNTVVEAVVVDDYATAHPDEVAKQW